MLHRVVVAGFVVVASATAARAQAPGDYNTEPYSGPSSYGGPSSYTPYGGPGSYVPPPPVVVAPAQPSVMANRWAVGLGIGHLTLAPKDTPDNKTDFGTGELSIRFRATLHFELELALGGGREQLPDGTQGDLEAKTGVIAARYRFNAERPWNFWIMGGLGGLQVAPHGSTDQQFQDSQRPLGELGIGIEHRWDHFALHAELRAISIGAPNNSQTVMPTSGFNPPPSTTTTTTQPTPTPTMSTSDQLSGGQFSIGASYYF